MNLLIKASCFILTMLLVCTGFVACSSSSSESVNKDLYIFSSKGEISSQFEKLCSEFESEKGIKVNIQQVGSGTDHLEPLRIQMNSSAKPAIFAVQGLRELPEWELSGVILDFNSVENDDAFKQLADSVPKNLRLSSDGVNNYGIPYCIEGYGYIIDRQMIADLIGKNNVDSFLKNMRLCSYEDLEKFVLAVDSYIKNPSALSFTLNNVQYTFLPFKTGLAQKLTGVFSVAGAERWTYCDHMINVALGAIYESPADAKNATSEQIQSMKGALIKYAQALDFKTSHAAGNNSEFKRGPEFVNTTSNDYNKAIQRFADGKALFIKQGNWANTNIIKLNPNMQNRLELLPIKLPLTQGDIKRRDITVEKFNSSIPVYVPNYFAINKRASEASQKAAREFLVWLNTSEKGRQYIINNFDFIPYNASSDLVLKDSINNSILSYYRNGLTLPAAYHGITETWSKEIVGRYLLENYMNKETWDKSAYEDIANFAIVKWNEVQY